MNNSVLKSELFQRTLESVWSDWRLIKEDFKNKLEWWEQTKVMIKSLTIEVSKKVHVTDKQVKKLGEYFTGEIFGRVPVTPIGCK
jgi:hypothetical protein